MKKELDRTPNIGEVQEEVLKFWKEDKTFEKSLKNSLVKHMERCNRIFLDLDNYGIYIPEIIAGNIFNRKTIACEIVSAFDDLKEKMGDYSTFKDTLFFLGVKRQLISFVKNN